MSEINSTKQTTRLILFFVTSYQMTEYFKSLTKHLGFRSYKVNIGVHLVRGGTAVRWCDNLLIHPILLTARCTVWSAVPTTTNHRSAYSHFLYDHDHCSVPLLWNPSILFQTCNGNGTGSWICNGFLYTLYTWFLFCYRYQEFLFVDVLNWMVFMALIRFKVLIKLVILSLQAHCTPICCMFWIGTLISTGLETGVIDCSTLL